jgi:hypothetical protein
MIFSSAENVSAQNGERIKVVHFGPPLDWDERNMQTMGETHWLGYFEELDGETLESIHAEAIRMRQVVAPSKIAFRDYAFSLHGVTQDDPNDNGRITIRASCSSFLEHCYEVQGVDLVEEESVPELASAEAMAGMVGESIDRVNALIRCGGSNASWPCRVLFPAYQMRAFEQPLEVLPHRPQIEDHPFVRANVSSPEEGRGDEEDADLE